jgi:hypothetical protein
MYSGKIAAPPGGGGIRKILRKNKGLGSMFMKKKK